MLKNSASSYGLIAKGFHWLMAAAIIGMFALGLWMHELPVSPEKFKWYGLHKSIGICVLAAVILRYSWRFINPVPTLPADMKRIEKTGAHGAHLLLYGLMFAIPLSGWIMSSASGFSVAVFGWFTMPDLVAPDKALKDISKEAHEIMAFAIIGLARLHGLAALFHHFVKKDNILRRMLPW